MNARYAANGANEMLAVIAKTAGMNEDTAKETMAGFLFPDIKEQLSEKWLGGGTQKFLKQVADFFVAQGTIPKARDSYDSSVDTSYLKAAAKM